MKTASIYTWYKRVSNLVWKNIDKINVHGFTIEISFMDVEDENKSIIVHVFNHKYNHFSDERDDCRIAHICTIANYLEEDFNTKAFEELKNFLENIETLL